MKPPRRPPKLFAMQKLKRRPRETSVLIPPHELDQILRAPRIHLELLLTHQATLIHLQSIACVLNLGTGLASIKQDNAMLAEAQSAVEVLTAATRETPPQIAQENRAPFLRAYEHLESVIRFSPRKTLVAAQNFIDKTLAEGSAEVRRVTSPGSPVIHSPDEAKAA